MNILITGGAGFIGTNAALYFGKSKKNKIIIVDNLSRVGTEYNLIYLKKNIISPLSFIKCNVQEIKSYLSAIKTADVIIHLAGQTAVTTSLAHPKEDFTSNIVGGFSLLEAVRLYNPKAIIMYSSTNKVYGNLKSHVLKKDEKKKLYINETFPKGVNEQEPLEFISPYGCSKGTIDQYMQDYARSFGLKTVVFRQSCIYGPHQLGVEDQGWIAHFSKQFLKNLPITLFGDGYQVRDLLYVEDLVRAYDNAIKKIDVVSGMVFNIGGGIENSFSLLQVLSLLGKKIGKNPEIHFEKERLGDQKYFVSDNGRAKKILDWQPTTLFKKGVDSLISWQQKNIR
ncbi:MAG: CDP-paratose 2-epimerase [Candidatus Magasanikbacteria bacterium CG_4_10_14_0_2_um_filter_41_31]|uniref:CDP-paratose 2-epimerase n=1 Tax=Candidatus Magasanikbacteria bacterium CG_4_10_14_0_2_um_filter_41_31 TaxID=1974639 RepID=A0A2M7V2I7_9BACT|nr:MAG: CDP-paratose 2-epimerase [Candidatus Magasanikbacteria bacterium CG_4_10_14_0_2_um_filter_41_31]